jgi:hypothetical protein
MGFLPAVLVADGGPEFRVGLFEGLGAAEHERSDRRENYYFTTPALPHRSTRSSAPQAIANDSVAG